MRTLAFISLAFLLTSCGETTNCFFDWHSTETVAANTCPTGKILVGINSVTPPSLRCATPIVSCPIYKGEE